MTDIRPSAPRHPSRREIVALGIGAFVVASVPFARRRARLFRRTVPAMGTIAELAVVHRDPQYAQAAIDAALARMATVERTMTRFDSHSDVGRANRRAAREAVLVTPATAAVIAAALEWAEAEGGALPTRQEQALLFANCKPHLQPGWHWSCEEHESDASYAWLCNFDDGDQGDGLKSYEGGAVAVRRV